MAATRNDNYNPVAGLPIFEPPREFHWSYTTNSVVLSSQTGALKGF